MSKSGNKSGNKSSSRVNRRAYNKKGRLGLKSKLRLKKVRTLKDDKDIIKDPEPSSVEELNQDIMEALQTIDEKERTSEATKSNKADKDLKEYLFAGAIVSVLTLLALYNIFTELFNV